MGPLNGARSRTSTCWTSRPASVADVNALFCVVSSADVTLGCFLDRARAEVLQRERIGLRDDFFALGGHSLLATRVISRLRASCGVDLPLRRFFTRPRLADLASNLPQAEWDCVLSIASWLTKAEHRHDIPLVGAVGKRAAFTR